MFKKKSYYRLSIIVATLFIGTIGNIYVNAQTNLSAGDLVVITTNTDDPDLFEFISRIDIETGTTIYFSDNAWSGDNTRRTTEGTIRYIAPGFIAAGTKLYFENGFETTYPTIWEMNGGFGISTAGDNILVYQGSAYNDPAPNFLYGIGFAGLSTWISSGGPTANNSYLPAGLSIGTTAFSYNYDNIQYGCSSLGILSSDFLSIVSDFANRGGSDTIRYATTACTFDATKPQVSIDLASGQDDPTSATTVKFLVTFSEAINTSTFDCSDVNLIGTAGTKTCTNISEIAPNDGTTFEVTATATDNGTIIAEIEADKLADINGNPNDIFSAVDNGIIIDQIPPVITILNPNTDPALSKIISASTNEGTLTQSVNAVGDTTCDNSLTFNAYSATTFNTEADNGKYICYKAIDTAGNITYELSNAIGGIDYTSPNISFISDVELGPIQSDTVSINRDDATVKKWMYDNNGLCSTAIGDYANDYTVSIVENTETNNGNYICFYGEDSLGNKTTLDTTNTINIDVTNPTYGGVVDGSYYSVTVNPTYSDANSVSATLNGSAFNSGDPVSADGVYSLVITDVAGNSTTAGFTIDKTNPSYGGFINGNYYNVTINPTYSDASSVSATLNGSAFNSGDTVSADGVYSLVITDVVGNSTTAGFTIDKTNPTYGGVVDGVYYNSDVTITYSDTNLNTSTLNGSSYVSGTPISADNSYVFYVEDLAGNSGTVNFIIDQSPPTATVAYATNSLTNTDVLSTMTASEPVTIDSAGGNTHNFALNGTHLFEFHDIAGNTGEVLATVNWIDKVPPELTGSTTITSSNSNTSFAKVGDVITITFTVNENLIANPTVSIVGGGVMNFASKIGNTYSYNRNMTSEDPNGIISISIAMEDLATNVNSETEISTITFDKTAPAGISITTPTTEQRLKGSNGIDPSINFDITWILGTEVNYGVNPIHIQYSSLGDFSDTYNISNGTDNDGSYIWTIPDGYNTDTALIRIIATDLAGNQTIFYGNTFNIDSIRPTEVIITTPSGLEYLKGNDEYDILYNGGLESNILTKTYALYRAGTFDSYLTVSPLNKRTVPSDLNNQSMLIRITVTDRAGWSNDGDSLQFTIDNTYPTLLFTNNSARRNTTVISNTTVGDNYALRLTGNAAVYKDSSFTNSCNGGVLTIPSYTTDGTYNSYACVADRAGNVTTGSQTYNIDKTNPFVNAGTDKITNGVIFQDTTVYDILSGGVMSNISSQARSQVSGPGVASFNPTNTGDTDITANTDGLYLLRLTAYDNAGNSSSDDINFTWDTISPIIVGGSVVNTNTSNPGYSFTSNETGTITYNGLCANGNISNVTIGTNSFSYSSRGEATYDNCQLVITDLAGNQTTHNVPTFTVDIPSGGGGGGGGGGGYISTCVKNDLVCIDGEYEKKSGVSCRGGDLGKVCGSDICVDGDYSGDPNDGMCYDLTKVEVETGDIIDEEIQQDTSTDTSTGERIMFESPFNKELTDAYSYALNIKITTIPDIKNANMTGVLIRAHLSKMMSQYTLKVLGKKPDTSRICIFNDMTDQSKEMQEYAVLSCQLGLMGLKTNGEPAVSFNPNDEVNRAIFGTTLSRAIRGDDYNEGTNWYEKHLQALNTYTIMNNIEYPMNLELRGYVMLMMMRADQGIIKSSYTNFESLRGKKIFVEKKIPIVINTDEGEFNETDLEFINSANKNYQLYEGYTAGASNVGIKYLQYFLKNSKYYTGTINGVNNFATIDGLLGFQLDKAIINDENNPAAGYLGPTTRNIINPLLKELLN